MTTRTPIIFDTTIYVATTGDDNNAGTQSSPFRTIQHAVDFICFLSDLQTDVKITIQVADGTYDEEILLYNFLGAAALDADLFDVAPITILGNETNPQNVVLTGSNNPTLGAIFTLVSVSNAWKISGFTIAPQAQQDGFDILTSTNLWLGVINFGNATIHGADCIFLQYNASLVIDGVITISGTGWTHFLNIGAACTAVIAGTTTINLTVPNAFNTLVLANAASTIDISPAVTINLNGNTITGKRFALTKGSRIINVGQNLSYFPGSTPGTVDATSDYDGLKFVGASQISGLPTTSNLSSGFAGVFKDTSGGGVYLAYNDNGVIKTVALS